MGVVLVGMGTVWLSPTHTKPILYAVDGGRSFVMESISTCVADGSCSFTIGGTC
jgi:hypothetical protein